jgi:hypothetical protein
VKPLTIGGTRVRSQSSRTQTNKATAPTKKACKCRPSRERLMGFEPTTFCMASGTWDPERPKKALQSTGFRAIGDQRCFPAFAAKSQGFPD